MRRFFNILLGALAMIAVALLSAFITMRLAIHGREVAVPNVAGLTVAEAGALASDLGLEMNVENHFYSTVTPAGRVLSQYPAPGTKVRREWVMRITESIGPQKVSVPDVIGKTEREATVTIRRLSLDLGTVAYVGAPGPVGIVLAQTPTPAAAGVDGPRISILVSEPVHPPRMRPAIAEPVGETTPEAAPPPETGDGETPAAVPDSAPPPALPADHSAAPAAEAYVMPDLLGLTLSAATARVTSMGLHIASMEVVSAAVKSVAPVSATETSGSTNSSIMKPMAPIAPISLANTVVAQTPSAGRRVTATDPIHITLNR